MVKLYLRVLGELRAERWLAFALVIANLTLAVAHFAEPVLFGRIIEALHTSQPLSRLVLAWVGFAVFSIIAGVVVALHADRLSHRRRLGLVSRFFERVLTLPQLQQQHSGRVMQVSTDGSNAMSWLWLGFFREQCASLVTLFVLLPMTLFLSWQLGTLLVALVLVFAALTTFIVGKTQRMQGQVAQYHHALTEHAADTLGNLPVVQSFTRIETELQRLAHLAETLLSRQLPVLSWWALAATLTKAAATITVTSVLVLGAYLVRTKQLNVGDVVTFVSLATMLIARLEASVAFVSSLFLEAPKMRAWFDVYDTAPSVKDGPHAAPAFKGEVRFEDVSFTYDGEKMALDHVDFTVKAGTTVALVGVTGSGKSTTLSLLHRAFDPTTGRVTIDGRDIRDFKLDSLRAQIGVVFQEPMMFARTLRDNLLVGKPEATDAELVDALTRAQATHIADLDRPIGERGRSLSGGERQRITIARALLKDPPILILDEATSALDTKTERAIQSALQAVMRDRTTLVIAHRLSTIRDADHILVFAAGRITHRGRYEDLVASGALQP